jgi:cation:H+ antiporter
VNPIGDGFDALGLTSVWTYLALFLAASLLMIWRLEALLDHGLEGTALGTLVMPYCSGLGNLLFVGIIALRHGPAQEVLTNCLVNNVTNLTLVLGLPALVCGLSLRAEGRSGKARGGKAAGKKSKANAAETTQRLNRLSLLLTLAAVMFFTGVTWMLGRDGVLDRNDGLVLMSTFLFWQCFQVFDVLKHNVRQRHSFGAMFYVDLLVVLAGAYGLYVSIDWLVAWLSARPDSGFISARHLGWLSGGLMVLPNALIAFYYAARRRADIVYASQVGDGHICIPLCLGLSAVLQPLTVPKFFDLSLALLLGAAAVHLVAVAAGGLPRWMGWPLLAGWAWFASAGLMG